MKISFIIIISIIAITQILTLLSVLKFEPVAKAGKVSKFYWRFQVVSPTDVTNVKLQGTRLNLAKFVILYVYGNSMKDYGIQSGNRVLVKKFAHENEKSQISEFPVLVFIITGFKSLIQSRYKLRKFVAYVTLDHNSEEKWGSIYDVYQERIKVSKQEFIDMCTRKASKMKCSDCTNNCVLSETYDEDQETYSYSIHPINTMYGTVEYAVAA